MLASQLIYTSWKNGNSPNKGYMVYAQSLDITNDETNDILSVMRYQAPAGLPYTPTQEEIEQLFPKNFAFFRLKSGRYCIAQSCYIGQDYTNRWGNYMLHAYVLSDIGDLIPARFINADIFRCRLTEEELNAEKAPDSLPQVDLRNPDTVLSSDIFSAFFNQNDRINILKNLSQASIDAVTQNKHIDFTEESKLLPIWLQVLSIIMPRNLLKKFFFSTYVVTRSELLTMACILPKLNVVTYGQQTYMNNTIKIDAQAACPTVEAGNYCRLVCDQLLNQYENGVLFAQKTEEQMLKYHLSDCDKAIKLLMIKAGDLSSVESLDELQEYIRTIQNANPDDLSDIFAKICRAFCNGALFVNSEQSIAILRALFPGLSAEEKEALLLAYLDMKLQSEAPAFDLCKEIVTQCPCAWDEAVRFMAKAVVIAHLEEKNNTKADIFLCYILISIYSMCKESNRRAVAEKVISIFSKQVQKRSIENVSFILRQCKKVSEELWKNVYQSVGNNLEDFCQNEEFSVTYLKLSLVSAEVFCDLLCRIIAVSTEMRDKCMNAYMTWSAEQPDLCKAVNQYAQALPSAKDFIDEINLLKYKSEPLRSKEELITGYRKNIAVQYSADVAKHARTIFNEKVLQFLRSLSDKEQVNLGIYLYHQLLDYGEPMPEDAPLFSIAQYAVFNGNTKTILFLEKNGCGDLALMKKIRAANDVVGLKDKERLQLLWEGALFNEAAKRKPNPVSLLVSKVKKNGSLLCLDENLSIEFAEEFLDAHLDHVIISMYEVYQSADEGITEQQIVEKFLKPFERCKKTFFSLLKKSLRSNQTQTNENLYLYFCYLFESKGEFRNRFWEIIEDYLKSLGKGKRNEVFDELGNAFEKSAHSMRMKKYIKDFNANNVGFFEKMFGLFSVEKDKKEKDSHGKKK